MRVKSMSKGNGMEIELSSKEVKEALVDYLVKKFFVKKRGRVAKSPIKEKDIEHISFNKNEDGRLIVVKFVSSRP